MNTLRCQRAIRTDATYTQNSGKRKCNNLAFGTQQDKLLLCRKHFIRWIERGNLGIRLDYGVSIKL